MEETHAQLTSILASLQEEKDARRQEAALRQQAKQRLAALEAAQAQAMQVTTPNATPAPLSTATPAPTPAPAATATPAPAPPNPVVGPKVLVPNKFDGSRGVKAEVYASQVGLYMMAYSHLFPDDQSKVVFAMSYLTGAASGWAQPMVQELFESSTSHLVTYDWFTSNFKAMYFNTEKKSKAEKAIWALRQTKSVAVYVHKFNMHSYNTSWETPTLISQFKQGLKRNVKVALMVKDGFATLEEIANFAIRIDNKLHGVHTNQPTAAGAATLTPDPDAMDLSATRVHLSKDEKAQRCQQGNCFDCGEHGHIARNCPGRGKTFEGKGQADGKLKIAGLEERLAKMEGSSSGAGRKEEGEGQADLSKNGGAQD